MAKKRALAISTHRAATAPATPLAWQALAFPAGPGIHPLEVHSLVRGATFACCGWLALARLPLASTRMALDAIRAVGEPAKAEPFACTDAATAASTASRAPAASAAAQSALASLLPPAAKEGEEKLPSCLEITRSACSTSSSTATAMATAARASPHAVKRRGVMRGQLSSGRVQA
jgi:hypothetical protein